MKKRTLLALAVAMSVTAVAAANPFSDVPANHWAYDAVSKLTSAGIVDGYGDNTYRGDRTMTRYEMAQIIARAMASSEKADAAVKAELDKLSVEFATELRNLGVRVTALENTSTNVKFSGDFRARYRTSEDGAWAGKKNSQDARFRMQAEGKVNDNWSVVGRFEAINNMRDPGYTDVYASRSDVSMDKMYAKGQYGDFGVRIGRMDVLPAYGIMFDDYMDAVEVSWNSNKLYGAFRYGNLNDVPAAGVGDPRGEHYDAYMAEVGVLNVVKGLNIRGQYTHIEASGWNGGIWEAGADYTIGNSGFKVTAAMADTVEDMAKGDTVWFAQLDYKGAKKDVAGSWGAWVGWRDFKGNNNAIIKSTVETKGEGWYVGGSYAPAKNIVLKAWYEDMEPIGSNKSKDYIRAQAEFFF